MRDQDQKKTVLVQYRGPADRDTEGTFTVKHYSSEKKKSDLDGWRNTKVALSPTNPAYKPIMLTQEDAQRVEVLADLSPC